jgi:hypothetical protein
MMNALSMAMIEGGWAMYAIVAIGLTALAVAARYAWRGEHRLLGPLRWLLAALIAAGCFGFFADLQMAMRAASVGLDTAAPAAGGVAADQRSYVVLVGLNESLNTLIAAFAFALLAALLVALGHWRRPQPAATSEPSRIAALGGLL